MLLRKLTWRGEPEPSLVWTQKVRLLGEDEHGSWFAAPRGTPVEHADGTEHAQWADAVLCFAQDHVAWFWRPDVAGPHSDVALTVDVAELVDAPSYVDLELDVFGYVDGRVEGRDEDEFEVLARSGLLSNDRLAGARAAYARLLTEVTTAPAFTTAPTLWWERTP